MRKAKALRRKKRIRAFAVSAFLLIAPLVLLTGVELIHRDGSIAALFSWMSENKPSFALNYVMDLMVLLLAYAITGSLLAGFSVSVLLLFTLSLVSYYKLMLIGDPLLPWDLKLNNGKQGLDILPLVSGTSAFMQLGGILLLAALVFALRYKLPRLSSRLWIRGIVAAASVFVLVSLAYKPAWTGNTADRLGITQIGWNQPQNYEQNGLQLGFAMNVKDAIVPKPAGYGETAIQKLTDNAALHTVAAGTAAKAEHSKPNVIFVMSEAFWDPTLLPGVTFSEDPLPMFHMLQQTATSGYLLSPQFGGGTSNVEYEVLTGNSMMFLPAGSNAYQQYINRATPSLASYFKQSGYKSIGIHSYESWFWNRNNAYKYLGFDSFMSKEFFDNPSTKGYFISDDEVSKAIINQTEQTQEPVFTYAVTMQNHGPYDDNRYGVPPIQLEGNLTDEAKSILQTYAQGIADADYSLRKLVEYYKESEEPTVIIFYGDHLPMLGYNHDVYLQSGFIHSSKSAEWSTAEWQKMHSVPFVMWSNFDLDNEQVPIISTSFLGGYVLNRLDQELPPQFAFTSELYAKVPAMMRNLTVSAANEAFTQVPEELRQDVEDYRNLQYDMLFGGQYMQHMTDESYYAQFPLDSYNKEFTKIEIDDAQMAADSKDSYQLTITGKQFYEGTFVWVNGQKLTPSKIDGNILSVDVPKQVYEKAAAVKIQVQQLNSKNIALAKSEILELPPITRSSL